MLIVEHGFCFKRNWYQLSSSVITFNAFQNGMYFYFIWRKRLFAKHINRNAENSDDCNLLSHKRFHYNTKFAVMNSNYALHTFPFCDLPFGNSTNEQTNILRTNATESLFTCLFIFIRGRRMAIRFKGYSTKVKL